ncbi:hypothetical protein [Pyrobaculum neutrophilum]|uniref:Uncharacterized protein n=1 Tax=Pyrobaculum neutrophilum (strain DSM 2338 / JCM 9278 / NBRC 100436 / V24Sta) TaxID=444157 RepID=B1YC99_PYRNV|nr:hypothetical protein [Pyrobaculum neutrophilum]ACB39412.1 conserved hypothetical protein [Pyrobaculum neutrophilum V24Sta]
MDWGRVALWFYAGFFAGALSTASREGAYASIVLFPVLIFAGEDPFAVLLGFAIAAAVAIALNLAASRKAVQGPIFRVGSLTALAGIAAGFLAFLLLPLPILKYLVAAAMFATGGRLLADAAWGPREFHLKHPAARVALNFLVGVLDVFIGTAASFALARAFVRELEALLPAARVSEVALSVELKHRVVMGGFVAGLGIFLGQRLVSCSGNQRLLDAAMGLLITATGFVYLFI